MIRILMTYLPLALILTSIVGFLYMNAAKSSNRKKRGKDKDYKTKDEEQQVNFSRLTNMYELFSKLPLTSKGTNQLHDLMAGIGVYSLVEQKVETARLLLTSYVLLIGSFSLVAFVTTNPILRIGAVIVALIFRRDFVNKKLRKERLLFWEDLYRSLSSIKNEYERCGSVRKAFKKAVIEDKARMLIGSVEMLFSAEQPQADLAYFYQSNAYHVLQRFAHLCYTSHYFGVSVSPVTGIDTFVSNLDVIMNNLQVDIDMAYAEKKKFYKVEKLPLVSLIIITLAPSFMTSRYPGLHYYYNSALGYVYLIGSMLAVIIGYTASTRLNDQDKPVDDTFNFEVRLFMRPAFKKFWENRLPNFNRPTENVLKESLSYLTPAQYKFRQVYCSILLGLFVFIVSIVYSVMYQNSSVVNLGALPAETLTAIQKKYDSPDEFAKKLVLNSELQTVEDFNRALSEEQLNFDASTNQLISSILLENKSKFQNAKYSPLYLFIVLAAMIFGFNLPRILLNRRVKLVAVEVKNEILILFALVVQMMYTPLKLRDYLKQFMYVSHLYPKTHLDCYINQFNNPVFIKEVALGMSNPQYYDFMEKLYTLRADKVAPEIFRETERRRDYLFGKVLAVREEKLKTNYQILTILLWVSLIVPLTLEVIVPLAQFSYTSITQYSNLIQD